MSPVERLHAAIEKLEGIKDELGLVVLTSDDVLLVRADDDIDEQGRYWYGITLWDSGSNDYEDGISSAIVTLHRTIDAQLTILRAMAEYAGRPDFPGWTGYRSVVLGLADVLGVSS